jgi:hypothetical protein
LFHQAIQTDVEVGRTYCIGVGMTTELDDPAGWKDATEQYLDVASKNQNVYTKTCLENM